MKRISTLTIVSCLFTFVVFGQNVGIGTNTPLAKLDIAGDLALREGPAISVPSIGGSFSITLNATGPDNSFYRVRGVPSAPFTLTGIANATDGQFITLLNVTTGNQQFTIKNADVFASDILTGTGKDMVIPAGGGAVTLQYSVGSSRWYVTSVVNELSINEWHAKGNSGTTAPSGAVSATIPATDNYMGTADAKDFVLGTNQTERVRVLSTGDVGIGAKTATDATASGRTLFFGEAANISGTSGVDMIIDNDNNTTNSEFRIKKDGDGASVLLVTQESNETGIGGNIADPVTTLHQDAGNATATYHKFSAGTTTGQTSTDGFDIGVAASGNAELKQRENLPMLFYTNNTEVARIDNAGNVGVGNTSPDDKLDVTGSAQISSYLKVGNPSAPASILASQSYVKLYGWTGGQGPQDWTKGDLCGSSTADWGYGSAAYSLTIVYNNVGSYSRKYLYSPWSWVPTGATNIFAEINFWCSLENDNDGVFLEYTTDGTTFTKVTSFAQGGYPDNANGGNTSCNGTDNQSCWNGINGYLLSRTNAISIAGNWIRFRFTGFENNSNSTGDFELYGFNLVCTAPATVGGTFASGNVYAEKNVYAGSNVLMGDVAEYFQVNGITEPGDLISLSSTTADRYELSTTKNNARVIGIYSTAPTITLNSPNSGVPVALAGRVPVKVCNENGTIKIGDYLTAASRPGYAMKATSNSYVIGKAVEAFDKAEGKITCLVQTGWMNLDAANSSNTSGGSFFIPKGAKSVIVRDETFAKTSRVFVSLLANAGSNNWLSKKEDGAFEISFAENVKEDIAFDYFIDEAKKTKASENNSGAITTMAHNDSDFRELQTLAELTNSKAPAKPADVSKFYKYVNGNVVEVTGESLQNKK